MHPRMYATDFSLRTRLHWIAINYHLPILQLLCPLLPASAFEIKNQHGKTTSADAGSRGSSH
jgi:hypothetical protein